MTTTSRPFTSSDRLTDADDRRHPLTASALMRESLIFLIPIPDERLGVIVYSWVDGQSKAGGMALVFSGENDKILHFHTEGVEVDAARDFDDWQVGPISIRHGAPHREAAVGFDIDQVSLTCDFTAITPAFTYLDNEDGCPDFLAQNRLEQSGKISGTLTIGDRVVPFETTGHRDHSWGTRDWTAIHHYKWVNVQGDGVAINFMHLFALDQLWIQGYVDIDGVQSPIVSGRPRIERDDANLFLFTSTDFEITDALGRTTRVTSGRRDVGVVWNAGNMLSHDAAARCEVDGRPSIIWVEEGWTPVFAGHRKALANPDADTPETRAALTVNRAIGVRD